MVKKILSLSLITLFLFQAVHFNVCTSYAWSFGNKEPENKANVCEKLNSCGGNLENLNCAISYLKKLLPTTSFQKMDKVGKKCEYKVFLWDYISVGEFPRNIGRLLNDAQKGYIRADAAGNVTNEIGGLFKIDADASREVLLKILKDN